VISNYNSAISYKIDTMTSINNLPAEIISEIAKYNPGSSMKLGLTCKNFNKILEKQLKENQEIVNHNKNIYRNLEYIEQRRNDIATKYMMIPGCISERVYKLVMKNLDDTEEKLLKERKCINCKRMSKDMSKNIIYYTFYTENVCNDCAHLCFNVKPVTINKIGSKKKNKGKKKRNTKNNNNTNNN